MRWFFVTIIFNVWNGAMIWVEECLKYVRFLAQFQNRLHDLYVVHNRILNRVRDNHGKMCRLAHLRGIYLVRPKFRVCSGFREWWCSFANDVSNTIHPVNNIILINAFDRESRTATRQLFEFIAVFKMCLIIFLTVIRFDIYYHQSRSRSYIDFYNVT